MATLITFPVPINRDFLAPKLKKERKNLSTHFCRSHRSSKRIKKLFLDSFVGVVEKKSESHFGYDWHNTTHMAPLTHQLTQKTQANNKEDYERLSTKVSISILDDFEAFSGGNARLDFQCLAGFGERTVFSFDIFSTSVNRCCLHSWCCHYGVFFSIRAPLLFLLIQTIETKQRSCNCTILGFSQISAAATVCVGKIDKH